MPSRIDVEEKHCRFRRQDTGDFIKMPMEIHGTCDIAETGNGAESKRQPKSVANEK